MNETNDAVIISDSRYISPKTARIIISATIMVALAAVVMAYVWFWAPTNIFTPLTSFGLDAPPPADITLGGHLYLSGGIGDFGQDTYALDLVNESLKEVTTQGANWEFSPIDSSHALLATVSTAEDNRTEIVVADFASNSYLELNTPVGFYKRNIDTFTNGQDGLMYTARIMSESEAVPFFEPSAWQIVIGAPQTQTFDILNEAFSPVYLEERKEIIFLKADGIYVYNLETKNTYRINSDLTGFNADAEIAVSGDRKKAVLTVPLDNSIIVFDMQSASAIALESVGVIRVPDRHFVSPVVSPDSRLYAVYGFGTNGEVSQSQVEIRSFENSGTVKEFPLDTFDPFSIRLNAWLDSFILETAKDHGETGHHDDGEEPHN